MACTLIWQVLQPAALISLVKSRLSMFAVSYAAIAKLREPPEMRDPTVTVRDPTVTLLMAPS